ncbi:MAG: TatD family hydrolase [Alphaproteobacteria bacterium]
MKIIDTHNHIIDFSDINLIADINITPAIELKNWKKIEKLHLQNPKQTIPAFGIHPWFVETTPSLWFEELEALLLKHKKALIGETGLDRIKDSDGTLQKLFLKKHIELAIKHKRPLIIHAVKADIWLEEFWEDLSKTTFVIHSFNSKIELLKKAVSNGAYISFSASILKNKQKELIINTTPLNKILLETDGPYQKGNIKDIALEISKIINIEYEDFLRIAYDNSINFINSSETKL